MDDVVILFDDRIPDPRYRHEDEPRRREDDRRVDDQWKGLTHEAEHFTRRQTKVRVVLRTNPTRSQVMVEVEDGFDAVGEISWYRLDFSRSDDQVKNLEDARAAYEVIGGIVATLYKRSRAAEEKLTESDKKVKELERRVMFKPSPPKPVAVVDPLVGVRPKFANLLELASSPSTTESERLAAATAANDMLKKYGTKLMAK